MPLRAKECEPPSQFQDDLTAMDPTDDRYIGQRSWGSSSRSSYHPLARCDR